MEEELHSGADYPSLKHLQVETLLVTEQSVMDETDRLDRTVIARQCNKEGNYDPSCWRID